jgi:GNAT superfamily N-acetyltransferase
MLQTMQIKCGNADDIALRQLYETAFPVEEQIPYNDLIYLLGKLEIDYTAYYDSEMLVGLTMVLHLPRYNWGWYFAVRDELRGKGYGQRILSALLEKYRDGHPFIIDIESPLQADAPNPEQRKRRHAFYLRNGLKDTPTSRTFEGITYTIMTSSDEPFDQQDYDDIIAALRSVWHNMPSQATS